MKPVQIQYCPSLLSEGFTSYSPAALKLLFAGKKVSHQLPYDSTWNNEEDTSRFMDNNKRISISGVQEKFSLIQAGSQLRLTEKGEQGTHILKPMPVSLRRPRDLPANEHVTMQIAAQVFGIETAACGLIFFGNWEAAYITKRFDVKADNTKRAKEDFATLQGKSLGRGGANFKYDSSYEEMGSLIKKYVSAWRIEMEKFFRLVIFNYVFSNGDAHLKNFALLESDGGDYKLSPAYDLVNTSLHIDDSDFAFEKGLFIDSYRSKTYLHYGHAGKDDFIELSRRLDMNVSRTERIIAPFLKEQALVVQLIDRSFMDEPTKKLYLAGYRKKIKSLNAAF